MAYKGCQNCDECVYIGEGDYACMKEEPKIVLTEHVIPTDDFGWCNSAEDVDAEFDKIIKEAQAMERKKERKKQRGKVNKRGSGKKATRSTKSN